MLQLKKIKKSKVIGDFSQMTLNGINICFRKNEFVAIIGAPGSGKTACLNIIGGLSRFDSGNLLIEGRSTKNFCDCDWAAYRNQRIGYISQNANILPHLDLLDNVEISAILSSNSRLKKRHKALAMLERVGLKNCLNKKPSQLSALQMQRVAVARALLNDPDIILADEPTGAFDTKTSIQMIELLKEVAVGKLLIMVTHHTELVEEYADRLVTLRDGEVVDDSNPYLASHVNEDFELMPTRLSFMKALKLSVNNLSTKTWRVGIMTCISSLGVVGLITILAGFTKKVGSFHGIAISLIITFISVPLIVSFLMAYLSTMERMKEIGVLQLIGASKKDVQRIFNTETFINGLITSMLALGVMLVLMTPINMLCEQVIGVTVVLSFNALYIVALVVVSLILTMLGSVIPTKIIKEKDFIKILK